MIQRFPACSPPLTLSSLPLHLTLSSSFFHILACRWATTSATAMHESSQPKTHSTLSQMTRVDPSDDPDSDSMAQSPYYENAQTVRIPTKSGTEVAIRSHHQSDDRLPRSGLSSRPSSRPSSRDGELDHDDAELLQKYSVTPSTADLDIPTRTLVKPLIETELASKFLFVPRAPPTNAPSNSQSNSSIQSSQAVLSTSFEKSNQEHQVSARGARQEPSLAPTSQGQKSIFSWLKSWLTLNIQAPIEYQEDVQRQRSPLFQNLSDAQVQKASSHPHAPQGVLQNPDHSHTQSLKQPKRKR
jgi:hypothetical protein